MALQDICTLLLSYLYLYKQLCNGLNDSGYLDKHTFKASWIKTGNISN